MADIPEDEYALVLSGGGARGAYQAGALRALYEVCEVTNNFKLFRNIVGVSAGAINAAYLAAEADNLDKATQKMCDMWRELTTSEVFATDYVTVGRTAMRLVRGVSLGGFSGKLRPTKLGLLNVEPLRHLLSERIHFENIPQHIASGKLNSLCVTATDYSTSMGVTFFMGSSKLKDWRRVNRIGIRQNINIDHIMGSAAIPIFFPPWKIGNRHYGDGCLRNTAPLSPARKVGANKILVIGVRKIRDERIDDSNIIKPTLGRVLSVVINAIFMDAIEVDIERVRIINETLRLSSQDASMRPIDIAHVQPSQAPSELAEARVEGLPPILRFLLSGLGSAHESSEILSYLTFDPIYLNALVDLGYADLIKQKENLIQILGL
ncbi:MAG TPA: patatin-like phospholipase family protein [Bdellovibrionales bacterium]|nr:patatin-like phospholipase family protein [Bdellovibrionales bacterium]